MTDGLKPKLVPRPALRPPRLSSAVMPQDLREPYERADARYEKGDFITGIEGYTRVLAAGGAFTPAYAGRGMTCFRMKDPAACARDFTRLAVRTTHGTSMTSDT